MSHLFQVAVPNPFSAFLFLPESPVIKSIHYLFMTRSSWGKEKPKEGTGAEVVLMDEPCPIGDPISVESDWKENIRLSSRLAIGLLAILATSCECERVFSQIGKLTTNERNRLGPEVIRSIGLQKG
jgi:hAT family C-terminal dimerisation region